MFRQSEDAIWCGVMKCIELCRSSNASSVVALGIFLGKLRQMGWHPLDIQAVEQNTLDLLQWNREGKTVGGSLAAG
jgi:hypothetical protein